MRLHTTILPTNTPDLRPEVCDGEVCSKARAARRLEVNDGQRCGDISSNDGNNDNSSSDGNIINNDGDSSNDGDNSNNNERWRESKNNLSHYSTKTEKIIKASVVCGVLVGEVNEDEIQRLSKYGKKVGFAYQVWDDILDVTGCIDISGKKVGGNLLHDNAHISS
ncbi:hypothetical protein Dsin_016468 [Dipteronia sinensis]|uniref:Uncharacterized protein n=1 Tax=Dipteronia sinensis TaxID=43782 RepID=A0AAE0E5S0_9ROSI|nr:hypothetical protein Dsin_016468 [Dipteronia sinensis]